MRILSIICLGILAVIFFIVAVDEEDKENLIPSLFLLLLIAIPMGYLLTEGP